MRTVPVGAASNIKGREEASPVTRPDQRERWESWGSGLVTARSRPMTGRDPRPQPAVITTTRLGVGNEVTLRWDALYHHGDERDKSGYVYYNTDSTGVRSNRAAHPASVWPCSVCRH